MGLEYAAEFTYHEVTADSSHPREQGDDRAAGTLFLELCPE